MLTPRVTEIHRHGTPAVVTEPQAARAPQQLSAAAQDEEAAPVDQERQPTVTTALTPAFLAL